MSTRDAVLIAAIGLVALGGVAGTAGQLPSYPAAKPGDAGYIAEDPQLARLIGRSGSIVRR